MAHEGDDTDAFHDVSVDEFQEDIIMNESRGQASTERPGSALNNNSQGGTQTQTAYLTPPNIPNQRYPQTNWTANRTSSSSELNSNEAGITLGSRGLEDFAESEERLVLLATKVAQILRLTGALNSSPQQTSESVQRNLMGFEAPTTLAGPMSVNQSPAVNSGSGGRTPKSIGPPISIPYFSGRKGENIETWLFQCNAAFEAKGTSDLHKPAFLVGYLKDASLQWYQNWVRMAGRPASWDEFQTEIRFAFRDPNHEMQIRMQLQSLTQRGDIRTYVSRFRNLLGQVRGIHPMDQILYFTNGLRDETSKKVRYKSPKTLEEAIQIAILYESAYFESIRSKTPNQRESGGSSQSYYNSSKFSNNNNKQTEENRNQSKKESGFEKKKEGLHVTFAGVPMSTEECRAKKLCFKCYKPGHISKNCRSKGNRDLQSNPRNQ
jgi:hypothetical protein